LAEKETRAEALEIVRGLVERVVVTPAADSGFEIELTGAIAAIIALAQDRAGDDPALLVCSESCGGTKPSPTGRIVPVAMGTDTEVLRWGVMVELRGRQHDPRCSHAGCFL
jgi:hypothetical protein